MGFPQHVFREYDIRGVGDRDLTDDFATALASAFSATLRARLSRAPRIALCRDGRLSSPRLHAAFLRGALDAGAEVVDVGIGPTPLLYFAAHHLEADGSVQITGSHNAGEDNGFKMVRGTAPFFGEDIQRLSAAMREPLVSADVKGSGIL